MNQFYSNQISQSTATLSANESQHLKVMRVKEGDEILVVDGVGSQYLGNVTKLHKKASTVEIRELIKQSETYPLLDIAIAPTKSIDRMEFFLEKATEIGVRNIFPFTSFHSERKVIKVDRLERIVLSAMKQSLRLWLPRIHPLMDFKTLIHEQANQPDLSRFIAHLKTDKVHFKDQVDSRIPTLMVIGPEGGFSDEEIQLAESCGYQSVTLGAQRLRTETAGIVTASIFANS